MKRSIRQTALLACGCLTCTAALHAQTDQTLLSAQALKKLSLEQLLDVEVTSVSGTSQRLTRAAAAVSVVSDDDISRTGATTVPEALRGIPGIHVGRENASSWAVSSRGFSSVNSEKLLVLSDTRSIYTPLFSGVAWDVQDYLMEDIDRIEVIRGPGATLWGANAVNGVINITSKRAEDTQGTYVELGTGTEERVIAAARYGGQFGADGHFRVFGKYSERDGTHKPGALSSDEWDLGHVGFRADWAAGSDDTFTVQGDIYQGDVGQYSPAITIIGRPGPSGDLNVRVSGGNVLGRWRRTLEDASDLQLRVYYDRTHRDDPSFLDDLDTLDADLQHRLHPLAGHQLTWGLNYRYTGNRNAPGPIFRLEPSSSQDQLFSAFVQDQVALSERFELTFGTKLEHNDFSGFEVQPSVRLGWDVSPVQTAWMAVSRAVRVPNRLERDIAIDAINPGGSPVVRLLGNKDFQSEELIAYEAGYRLRPLESLYVDIALFHHAYERLASFELGSPFVDGRTGQVVVPILNQNLGAGHSRGIESTLTFSASEHWRLIATYAYVELDIASSGEDINRLSFYEGATPRHQASLRSSIDVGASVEIDAMLRYSSEVRSVPIIVSGEGFDAYSDLDVRIAWRAAGNTEVSLVGQSLLHGEHVEFGRPDNLGGIERSVYGKIAWRF